MKRYYAAWLEYLSRYPHQSAYFRSARQFENQISIVNGKKAGTDINLYKLFTEQCYNLLRDGGQCGIVIPSGIYTDLGTKQLRELLFAKTTDNRPLCIRRTAKPYSREWIAALSSSFLHTARAAPQSHSRPRHEAGRNGTRRRSRSVADCRFPSSSYVALARIALTDGV